MNSVDTVAPPTDYSDCLRKPVVAKDPPPTEPTDVGTDRYMSAKFKFSMLAKIRSGEIQGMVDKEGNYYEKDEIYINVTPDGNRKKVVFNKFCKTAKVDVTKIPITKTDFYHLYIILNNIDKNNTINWDEIILEAQTLAQVRSRLRKAGLVDKIKLFHSPKWYLNPFFCTTTKTVDARLFNHFLKKIDYCLV
jgi:hypothetical protein